MLAADSGAFEVVKLLIEFGAFVDARDKDEWTPLTFAAVAGKKVIIKYLI